MPDTAKFPSPGIRLTARITSGSQKQCIGFYRDWPNLGFTPELKKAKGCHALLKNEPGLLHEQTHANKNVVCVFLFHGNRI